MYQSAGEAPHQRACVPEIGGYNYKQPRSHVDHHTASLLRPKAMDQPCLLCLHGCSLPRQKRRSDSEEQCQQTGTSRYMLSECFFNSWHLISQWTPKQRMSPSLDKFIYSYTTEANHRPATCLANGAFLPTTLCEKTIEGATLHHIRKQLPCL